MVMGACMDEVDDVTNEVEALRARAEAAEADLAAARGDLSALTATVGAAVVASALAPGESLSAPPQHVIVSTVNRLRARAETAEAEGARLRAALEQAQDDAEFERGRVIALEMCVATRDDAIAETHAEAARLRERLAQARAEGEAAGAARERAAVAAYLREQADEDHDPWIFHLADDVAAGQHWGAEAAMRETGQHVGAATGGAR